MTTKFSGLDSYNEKIVGCNVGDLKMRLSRSENTYLNNGIYNDVIHVEIRAES
jgi:hypothetical protein